MSLPGTPSEFIILACGPLEVALLQPRNLETVVAGLMDLLFIKTVPGERLVDHLFREERLVLNLPGLLPGFAILARHLELSRVPDRLPRVLPNDGKGRVVLLSMVAVLLTFLGNIVLCAVLCWRPDPPPVK